MNSALSVVFGRAISLRPKIENFWIQAAVSNVDLYDFSFLHHASFRISSLRRILMPMLQELYFKGLFDSIHIISFCG
jgi:hypothetical protein